ncbi:hypothetical protein GCM10011609_82790 [Lentzea pudingi]|uniref:Uncharacterized protein n=1 Tax=Lentzea pudingi TaxID=1789439 RepID=A0ABQ2IQQ8_9PSEU|nr:hypothetical protein [Lentzea pudingi]GGN27459.1 hypothetical protein GCM10011609_82790 [Lentzea pudingi]
MELDALFGDGKNSDVDTIDPDAEVQEFEDVPEDVDAVDESEGVGGIGWKMLTLFVLGGLVITALAVAFMVWVIEGLVL